MVAQAGKLDYPVVWADALFVRARLLQRDVAAEPRRCARRWRRRPRRRTRGWPGTAQLDR